MNVIDEYIRSFLNGTLNVEGHVALRQWIGQDKRNRRYFEDCIIIWKATAITTNEAGFDVDEAYDRLFVNKKKAKRVSFYPPLLRIISVAVLLLLVGTTSLFFFINPENSTDTMQKFVVEVPSGAKSKVTFPDGSVVWLNSESKIEYDSDFAKSSRNVSLYGEGYFEVSENKSLPFVVKTEKLFVKVLGTKFNLKSYQEDQDIKVILKEGAVKVGQLVDDADLVTLKPDQQLTYQKSGAIIQIDSVDASHIDAWRDGSIIFDRVSLNEISKQLKRLYDIPIQIENEALKNIVYYSDFKGNVPIEKILEILSSGNKFNYEVKSDYIRIYI